MIFFGMPPLMQLAAVTAIFCARVELLSAQCLPINLSIATVAMLVVVLFGYLTDLKVQSVTTQLKEKKRKVEDLELKAQQQAKSHAMETRASKDDIKVLEQYIKKLEEMKLLELSEERNKNKQLKADHLAHATQCEEEICILMDQDELQKTYIRKLETAVFQMKKDVKKMECFIFSQVPDSQPSPRKKLQAASTKKVSFAEEVHVFIFDNQLPTIKIKRFPAV